MEKIKIEKGVQIPERCAHTATFKSMAIGDSIVVTANRIQALRSLASKSGFKIASRAIGDGNVRVWKLGKNREMK